jgi:glutamate-5-semialdehyde dehydrogenase
MHPDLVQLVTGIAQRARAASLVLSTASTAAKNDALNRLAALIDSSHEELLAANRLDLDQAAANRMTRAQIDRISLDADRLRRLADSVREVAALPDPVGAVLEEWTRPNGLRIRKVRVPIGVIGVIFEARPNVTVDCAILCLKAGNAAILRGGKEIFHTNTGLAGLIRRAVAESALTALETGDRGPSRTAHPVHDAVQLIPTTDRAALTALLKLDSLIHCVIPRGGEGLIRFVAETSTIPVIKHFTGVCCVYLHDDADPAMAEAVLVNSKAQRPGVCNAAEQLLVHSSAAEALLPGVASALVSQGVELRCDGVSAAILARAGIAHRAAGPSDFKAEFLDLILAVRVVDSLESAIAAINRDGSAHTDAILTRDPAAAERFQAGVDSAVVLWNASTRFNDGHEFGFGAEIGISTDRLHARGPMGLPELCTYKYLVSGSGQTRIK